MHVGPDAAPVQFNFYRLQSHTGDQKTLAVSAGAIRARVPAVLPITTSGYLDIVEAGHSSYAFDFHEHSGKVDELLAFDSTCFPRPVFVSPGEFVVLGCKGGDERRLFAGFNLRGEEMWQQGFYESYVGATFTSAPQAGRFALSRILIPVALADEAALSTGSVNSQEVRVYQTYDGKQLFHIDCSPVERAQQNFDLSPDGLQLAVIREVELHHKGTRDTPGYTGKSAGIEIYALPALSEQDRSAVTAAGINAPKDTGVPIDVALARLAKSKRETAPADTLKAVSPTEPPAPDSQIANPADSSAQNLGDPHARTTRAAQAADALRPRRKAGAQIRKPALRQAFKVGGYGVKRPTCR